MATETTETTEPTLNKNKTKNKANQNESKHIKQEAKIMIENEKVEEIMFELEEKTEKTLSVLEGEYSSIRAGRANPKILDRVEVEAYGGMSKLIELGNVSALDARCLQINLWDKSLLKAVEKAILQSNLGVTPTNDGNVIRIVFPVMTEERRKELVKQIKKMGEEAKVAVRNTRRDAMDALKKMKTAKELSEDDFSGCEADVEKSVAAAMSKLEGIVSAKEKELMSI